MDNNNMNGNDMNNNVTNDFVGNTYENVEQNGAFSGTNAEQGNSYQDKNPDQDMNPNQGYGYEQQNEYMNNNTNQNYYEQSGYQGYQYPPQGGYQQELEEPVSMGEWLVTLLLITFVPCVNIILMFVWAFSKKEKKSKSNYFKAQLIISGIMIAFYIIIFLIFGVSFLAALSAY